MSKTYTDKETAERLLLCILNAPMPNVIDDQLRGKGRIAWSKAVRAMLKQAGIKSVSVRTPNYSMASSIDIQMPTTQDETVHDNRENHFRDHTVSNCRFCTLRSLASRKMTMMVLAAFPDLDDRSRSIEDYFDFCFSID